jgi:hypothetical protein
MNNRRKFIINGLSALFGLGIASPTIARARKSPEETFDDCNGWDVHGSTMSTRLPIPEGFEVMPHLKDEKTGRVAQTACLPLGSEPQFHLTRILKQRDYTHIYEIRLYRTKFSEWLKSPNHPLQYMMVRGLITPPIKHIRGYPHPFDHHAKTIVLTPKPN